MAKAKVVEEVEIEEPEVYTRPNITLEGRYPSVERFETGLLSFDLALSHKTALGLPMRNIIEIFGPTGVGKSTLAYYLAGVIAKQLGQKIAIADLEMLDREYIIDAVGASGYEGMITLEDVTSELGVPYPHEKILWSLARHLLSPDYGAVLYDSVGATQSMAEMDVLTTDKAKEATMFGAANMGKDAKLVTQVVEALRTALITKLIPSTALVTNHQHPNLGTPGKSTPGGMRLRYLAGVRMAIWNGLTMKINDDDPDSMLGSLVYGQTHKMRWGGAGRQFQYYVIPGQGVHPGVTAMFDCFEYGLAIHDAGRVKLNGRSLGYLKKDFLKNALEGGRRKFYAFQDLIAEYREEIKSGKVQIIDPSTVRVEEVEE